MVAWNYPEKRRKMYVWSDCQRRMQKAFTITQVAELLNKHRMTIDEYVREGWVRTPQRTYRLETGAPGKFMFSEDEVLELYEFALERAKSSKDMMSMSEMEALVRRGQMLYTKTEDGELVPLWKEKHW